MNLYLKQRSPTSDQLLTPIIILDNPSMPTTPTFVIVFIFVVAIATFVCSVARCAVELATAGGIVSRLIGAWRARQLGLKPAATDALPVFAYRRTTMTTTTRRSSADADSDPDADADADSDPDADAQQCTVCLSPMREGAMAKLLPDCNHVFHVKCIDTWLHSRATCPVCRGNVKPPNVKVATGALPPPLSAAAAAAAAAIPPLPPV